MKLILIACAAFAACTAAPSPSQSSTYRILPRNAIVFTGNPMARHCSELTRDFRDVHKLLRTVRRIEDISVVADRMIMRSAGKLMYASRTLRDGERWLGFWYRDDSTLAIRVYTDCPDNKCPTSVHLIKYNGASTPSERAHKLCFEQWLGHATRLP